MNNLFKPAIDGIEAKTQFKHQPFCAHPHTTPHRPHTNTRSSSSIHIRSWTGAEVPFLINQTESGSELFSNRPLPSSSSFNSMKLAHLFCRRDFKCPRVTRTIFQTPFIFALRVRRITKRNEKKIEKKKNTEENGGKMNRILAH